MEGGRMVAGRRGHAQKYGTAEYVRAKTHTFLD